MSADPLLRLREVMVLSGLTSAGLLALLLLLTRWRTQWIKLLDWEQRVWHRLGAKPEWTNALRRVEEKRAVIFAVAALFVLHLGLFAVAGGAFLYFKPKLERWLMLWLRISLPQLSRRLAVYPIFQAGPLRSTGRSS